MDELDAALRTTTGTKYYKPLRDAADEYIQWAQTPEQRIYLGVRRLDEAMRGTAPRQMTGVVGYTQGGKTVLMTHMVLANPDAPITWFAPDESRMAMHVKLTAARTGVSATALEAQLSDPDTERQARAALYETAEALPNLFICEDNLFPYEMWEAVQEQQEQTGETVKAVVFDYARLLKVEGDDRAKLEALKYWTTDHNLPLFVIHQSSRTAGRDGEPITLSSGNYGGEDVFTHMIGVRRKMKFHESILRDFEKAYGRETDPKKKNDLLGWIREQELEIELQRDKITVNLVKNKVPPNVLVPEFDMTIDWRSGRLSEDPLPPRARDFFG